MHVTAYLYRGTHFSGPPVCSRYQTKNGSSMDPITFLCFGTRPVTPFLSTSESCTSIFPDCPACLRNKTSWLQTTAGAVLSSSRYVKPSHWLKVAKKRHSSGVSRLSIVCQVMPPCVNERAPTRALAQHPQALRARSCRRSVFIGRLLRWLAVHSRSQRRACGLWQWRQTGSVSQPVYRPREQSWSGLATLKSTYSTELHETRTNLGMNQGVEKALESFYHMLEFIVSVTFSRIYNQGELHSQVSSQPKRPGVPFPARGGRAREILRVVPLPGTSSLRVIYSCYPPPLPSPISHWTPPPLLPPPRTVSPLRLRDPTTSWAAAAWAHINPAPWTPISSDLNLRPFCLVTPLEAALPAGRASLGPADG